MSDVPLAPVAPEPGAAGAPKTPRANFIRFKLARLQAESSRNMYSLHGFDALMRAVFLEVCQRLTVVSYCIPGSPQCQVASEILRSSSRALKVCTGRASFTAWVLNSPSRTTAYMKSSFTRTELLAFWKNTDAYASESGPEPSQPCSTSAHALASSFCLH